MIRVLRILYVCICVGIFDERNDGHSFTVTAASTAGAGGDPTQETFSVHRTGAAGLQQAMVYTLGASYICSAVLYCISYCQLKWDLLSDGQSTEHSSFGTGMRRNSSDSPSNPSSKGAL